MNRARVQMNRSVIHTHGGRLTDFLTIQIEEEEEDKVISLKQLKL